MLKAILFDLDGTLIDSEHFYFECWNEILAEVGEQLTFDDWVNNYAGFPMPANARKLIDKYHINETLDNLVKRREALTIERFKTTDVQLMPFVPEILNFFKDKGLTMAIVTSSVRKDVEAIFERNRLGHFFKLIITRTEVTNSKPHPESYNLCCEQLDISKDECIVFEDTINGLTAAKAAGLVCYAIQRNTNEHHKLIAADKIFLDFNESKDYLLETKQL
jgi:beta-phosphoglucomutase